MSSILNFYLKNDVIINVPKQLPVNAIIVLVTIILFLYAVVGKTPALNEGQYIHKKKVPIVAKIFELYVVSGLS